LQRVWAEHRAALWQPLSDSRTKPTPLAR